MSNDILIIEVCLTEMANAACMYAIRKGLESKITLG